MNGVQIGFCMLPAWHYAVHEEEEAKEFAGWNSLPIGRGRVNA
jgi:hypothetical protein